MFCSVRNLCSYSACSFEDSDIELFKVKSLQTSQNVYVLAEYVGGGEPDS